MQEDFQHQKQHLNTKLSKYTISILSKDINSNNFHKMTSLQDWNL